MKQLTFILLLFTGFAATNQQSRTINGTVYDGTYKKPLRGVNIMAVGKAIGTLTNQQGRYSLSFPAEVKQLKITCIGYKSQIITLTNKLVLNIFLKPDAVTLNEVIIADKNAMVHINEPAGNAPTSSLVTKGYTTLSRYIPPAPRNTESYKGLTDNGFQNVKDQPLSTFSADVDAASYSNVRRFINNGELPPADAVRIEEMINYFKYNLPPPVNSEPVAIHTELSSAPWNPQHRLLRIGMQARRVSTDKLPPSNLVFLIDVSGSMNEPNKLPLVKSAMKLLVDQLRAQDRVAIVVYAGSAGLVLPATAGNEKRKILDAINQMSAGGSTAGGEGIQLAYKIARANFIKGGNNRVVLSTDGDFNVGASSDEDMEHLIERERQSNVHLSVLGFGMGNYKDSKMETLADKGDGNYAYIDNLQEAKNKLVNEFGGTMFMVAKDVKLQVEFNPAKVEAYRLLGYEDRALSKEDFNNDSKDAGDMGAGHTVTAFYEIIPYGTHDAFAPTVDPLKYQIMSQLQPGYVIPSNELLTIKFRYKQPASMQSKLNQKIVYDVPLSLTNTSADFRFAAAVAEAGMLLRQSRYKQQSTFDQALSLAKGAKANDEDGYRSEFIRLIESAKLLGKEALAVSTKEK